MVLKFFDGGSILISDIKSGQQFQVNGHHLKLYVTLDSPTNTVYLHLPEVHKDVTTDNMHFKLKFSSYLTNIHAYFM